MGKHSKFGRIGVLMGGPSSEREISFKSAKAVCASLKALDLDFVSIDIQTDDAQENIRLIKSYNIDCAFIALHGYFGEDGKIQQILDELDIPYTGSSASASKLAMDKASSHKIFAAAGLNVPRYIILNKDSLKNKTVLSCGFDLPWVIKPATHGSSIGLSIIDDKEELEKALDLAFGFDEMVLIEEYIKGRELTVGILRKMPLSVIEIIPKSRFFDFEAKYHSDDTEYIVPARLDAHIAKKVQETALLAHQSLGCFGCSRVDIILSQDNIAFVLELNNIPGLTEHSLLPKAAENDGINFNQLCLNLIESAYEKK